MRTHTIAKIIEKQNKENAEIEETVNEIIALTEIEGENTKATIKVLAERLKELIEWINLIHKIKIIKLK